MSRLTLGLSLFVFGSATALVNWWAVAAFPEEWGGPNIGGGGLLLLSLVIAIGGLMLTGSALMRRRQGRVPPTS